jgi:hypothetical protein
MPQQPVILSKRVSRSGGPRWVPATLAEIAPMLIVAGLALSIVGWTDFLLLFWPQQFGHPEWEFGIVAAAYDTLPVPLTGMLLLGIGLRARGAAPALVRMLGAVSVLVAVACLVLLIIFTLDVPLAWKAMHGTLPGAQTPAAQPNLVEIAGIKRGIAKALVFGLGYVTAFSLMGIMLWRGAGRTEPARVETSEV